MLSSWHKFSPLNEEFFSKIHYLNERLPSTTGARDNHNAKGICWPRMNCEAAALKKGSKAERNHTIWEHVLILSITSKSQLLVQQKSKQCFHNTFDCVGEGDCDSSKWNIASDMTNSMANSNWNKQLQNIGINGLQKQNNSNQKVY